MYTGNEAICAKEPIEEFNLSRDLSDILKELEDSECMLASSLEKIESLPGAPCVEGVNVKDIKSCVMEIKCIVHNNNNRIREINSKL